MPKRGTWHSGARLFLTILLKSLYRKFKRFGWRAITVEAVPPKLESSIRDHLNETFGAYARFSAWDLERMTHAEKPWQVARLGLGQDENGHREIDLDVIKDFYRSLIKKNAR